jgi:hypothetical protein
MSKALCMEVHGLTMSDKKKGLMMNIHLGLEDWDPFLSSRWRGSSRSFWFRASDLDPTQRFPNYFLGLFKRVWVDMHLLLGGPSP